MEARQTDPEGNDSWRLLSADFTPHHWAASISLKGNLSNTSPYLSQIRKEQKANG